MRVYIDTIGGTIRARCGDGHELVWDEVNYTDGRWVHTSGHDLLECESWSGPQTIVILKSTR